MSRHSLDDSSWQAGQSGSSAAGSSYPQHFLNPYPYGHGHGQEQDHYRPPPEPHHQQQHHQQYNHQDQYHYQRTEQPQYHHPNQQQQQQQPRDTRSYVYSVNDTRPGPSSHASWTTPSHPSPLPTPAPIPPPPPPAPAQPTILVPKDDYEGIANLSSQELKGEVIRLRQIVRRLTGLLTTHEIDYNAPDQVPSLQEEEKLVSIDAHRPKWAGSGDGPAVKGEEKVKVVRTRKPKTKNKKVEGDEADGEGGGENDDIQAIAKPKYAPLPKDAVTGKRIENTRRLALAKVVRLHMLRDMGVAEGSPLPSRPAGQADEEAILPDWTGGLSSDFNIAWIQRVATAAHNTLLSPPAPQSAEAAVPTEDIDLEIIQSVARTAFANYIKRWTTENDPDAKSKLEAHSKQRRRWGRKDLKQKRRVKASAFFPTLPTPPDALRIEYMSSEYSSPGPDSSSSDEGGDVRGRIRRSERRREGRRRKWDEMRGPDWVEPEPGQNGRNWSKGFTGGAGKGKILEIRPMSWRTPEYINFYATLDAHAPISTTFRTDIPIPTPPPAPAPSSSFTYQFGDDNLPSPYDFHSAPTPSAVQPVAELAKHAHAAPSHTRFTMPSEFRRPQAKKDLKSKKRKVEKIEKKD